MNYIYDNVKDIDKLDSIAIKFLQQKKDVTLNKRFSQKEVYSKKVFFSIIERISLNPDDLKIKDYIIIKNSIN